MAAAPHPGCPACGAALRPWRRAPAHEPAARVTYLLLRCPRCGTAVTDGPAPVFEQAHEAGAYRPGAPRGSRAAAPLLRAFDRRRLALLRRVAAPPGPLLDVGAGRGRFVAHARAAGWDARGIEPSSRAPSCHVQPVGVEQAQVPAASLGAVTLWHVLEHLDDPEAAVARVHGWLRPGGGLVLGVPDLTPGRRGWVARTGTTSTSRATARTSRRAGRA